MKKRREEKEWVWGGGGGQGLAGQFVTCCISDKYNSFARSYVNAYYG